MLQDYFSIAVFGLITSFAFALLISTFFRLWNRTDLNVSKKRAAHALPTSRLGGLGVGASILLIVLLNDNVWHLEIALASFPIFSATLGLFMLNFPQGRIFLGDAGAYTLGFLLAVSFITLQSKNPEISAWAIMLIIFWPIVDMAHAILRRRLKHNRADRPDFLHFHHVVMRSLIIYSSGRLTK